VLAAQAQKPGWGQKTVAAQQNPAGWVLNLSMFRQQMQAK